MKYIQRDFEGIMIDGKNSKRLKYGLIQYIDILCVNNLSTYQGRISASKKILSRKSLLPVYINRNIVLFPIISIRDFNCILINYCELLSTVSIANKQSKVVFKDLSEVILPVSNIKLRNQIQRIGIILRHKNNRNTE